MVEALKKLELLKGDLISEFFFTSIFSGLKHITTEKKKFLVKPEIWKCNCHWIYFNDKNRKEMIIHSENGYWMCCVLKRSAEPKGG